MLILVTAGLVALSGRLVCLLYVFTSLYVYGYHYHIRVLLYCDHVEFTDTVHIYIQYTHRHTHTHTHTHTQAHIHTHTSHTCFFAPFGSHPLRGCRTHEEGQSAFIYLDNCTFTLIPRCCCPVELEYGKCLE